MERVRDLWRRMPRRWLLAFLLIALPGGCAGGADDGRPSWRRVEPGLLDGPRLPSPEDTFRA